MKIQMSEGYLMRLKHQVERRLEKRKQQLALQHHLKEAQLQKEGAAYLRSRKSHFSHLEELQKKAKEANDSYDKEKKALQETAKADGFSLRFDYHNKIIGAEKIRLAPEDYYTFTNDLMFRFETAVRGGVELQQAISNMMNEIDEVDVL